MQRDRTKQINLDFTKYPKAKEIYDNLPHANKTAWVSDAIEEKYDREYSNNPFTPEQEQRIRDIVKEMMEK